MASELKHFLGTPLAWLRKSEPALPTIRMLYTFLVSALIQHFLAVQEALQDYFSKQAGGLRSGSFSKTMLQLRRPRKTCNASAPMSQEGFSWHGPPSHLICHPISGLGWSSNWVIEGALTKLMTCINRLMAIRDSITLAQLHALFTGMNDRMKRVVKLQGSHIGK